MNILSLYDGMACGHIAFMLEGVPIDRYVAYEIDGYAVKTAVHNFPDIEQRGDVFDGDFTEFEGGDWLIGGSPCTYWSIAQKNNRETEASGLGWELFSQYVRALKEAKPRYFLYENNKSMSKAIRESITEAFGFEPVCINSALVSAQNRQRLYWVGRRNEDGTYSRVDVPQPEDRGILLKDILEDGCLVPKDKSYCLKHQAGNARDYFKKHHTDVKFEPVCVAQRGRYTDSGNRTVKGNGPIEQYYEARDDGKTNALTTVQKDNAVCEPVNVTADGKAQTIKSQYAKNNAVNMCCYSSTYGASGVAEPVRVGTYPNNAKNQSHDSQQYRIYSTEAKSVALCGNGGGLGAKTGLYAIQVDDREPRCYATPCEWDEDGRPIKAVSCADGKVYTVYEVKDGKITIKGKEYPIKLVDGFYIIRKLTVGECMRLQTVPEWYEFPVSDTQAYKVLGNGWTVEVIRWLLKCALNFEEGRDGDAREVKRNIGKFSCMAFDT